MRVWGGLPVAVLFVSATLPVSAAPFVSLPSQARDTAATLSADVVPVVVFGKGEREPPRTFATRRHLDPTTVEQAHVASGLIQCGKAHGAGQLTLADDVITSAAHVFYDENGLLRAKSCTFDIVVDGRESQTPIELSSIVAGSKTPYDAAVSRDWAVARLTRPLSGIRPYGIASNIHEDEPVTFVARGHIDWGNGKAMSMQDCRLHDQLSVGDEGTREFSFDCDTGDGASGGALMFDRDYSRVGAILVGWRSNRPFEAVPFSPTHYNFAITMEGMFKQAVIAAAGKVMVQK